MGRLVHRESAVLTGVALLLTVILFSAGCSARPTTTRPSTEASKTIDVRAIRVDPATGRLKDDVQPAISREQAIELASRDLGFTPDSAVATLRVWPSGGEPRLQWLVELTGSSPLPNTDLRAALGAAVCIDATTGEVLALPY